MSQTNENKQYFRASNRDANVVKFWQAEGYEHALMKFRICWELDRLGKAYLTEPILSEPFSGRPDVVNLTDGIIYEVLNSEKEKDAIKKRNKYPPDFYIHFIKVDEEITEKRLM